MVRFEIWNAFEWTFCLKYARFLFMGYNYDVIDGSQLNGKSTFATSFSSFAFINIHAMYTRCDKMRKRKTVIDDFDFVFDIDVCWSVGRSYRRAPFCPTADWHTYTASIWPRGRIVNRCEVGAEFPSPLLDQTFTFRALSVRNRSHQLCRYTTGHSVWVFPRVG